MTQSYPLPPFGNRFAELPPAFYTRLQPTPLPAPYLVGFSEAAAATAGLPRPWPRRRPQRQVASNKNRALISNWAAGRQSYK